MVGGLLAGEVDVPACGPGVSDVQLVVCEGLDIGGKLVKQLQVRYG